MMEHRNPHPEPRRSSQSVKILSQTWHPKHPVALQPRMGLIALQSGTQRRQPGVCHPSVRQDTAIPCLCWFWELHLSIRAQSSSRTPGFLEMQWVSQGRLDKKKKKKWTLAVTRRTLLPATCPTLEEPQDRAAQGASAGQTALAACGMELHIDHIPLVWHSKGTKGLAGAVKKQFFPSPWAQDGRWISRAQELLRDACSHSESR